MFEFVEKSKLAVLYPVKNRNLLVVMVNCGLRA